MIESHVSVAFAVAVVAEVAVAGEVVTDASRVLEQAERSMAVPSTAIPTVFRRGVADVFISIRYFQGQHS